MARMSQDAPTFSPLYRQIKTLITQALESGEWRPGQAIPSEQELAARFSVSQGTVRKAIDEMAAENLSEPWLGPRVRPPDLSPAQRLFLEKAASEIVDAVARLAPVSRIHDQVQAQQLFERCSERRRM